jgi:hypothetical protein
MTCAFALYARDARRDISLRAGLPGDFAQPDGLRQGSLLQAARRGHALEKLHNRERLSAQPGCQALPDRAILLCILGSNLFPPLVFRPKANQHHIQGISCLQLLLRIRQIVRRQWATNGLITDMAIKTGGKLLQQPFQRASTAQHLGVAPHHGIAFAKFGFAKHV